MDLNDKHNEADYANELWIKEHYDKLVASKTPDYCLVVIELKNFQEYIHLVGHEKREQVILFCFDQLSSCLEDGEYIARIHSHYFNLLIKCPAAEDDLHTHASQFHHSIRNAAESAFGNKLFLDMGFYPMIKDDVDFYNAQYFADLCRFDCPDRHYPESNYDMYYVSYQDQREEFRKFDKMVDNALKNGDFKLFLQPKVNTVTGEVTSAEALMRWIDPQMGMIPLSSFYQNLETNGYVRDVDLYLFEKACSYLDKWYHKYNTKISISFNMSRAYFNGPYFMPEHIEAFEKYSIPADLIRIELLESIVLNETDKLKPMVKEIYDYGFSCSLDDFGSGFSSFDVLANVRLSELKIDRSLFKNVQNHKERSLIRHIVDIAHDMDMVTVAEGIETKEYANYLKEIGCDYIQGFYYYRPMPVDEFEKLFILKK